MLGFGLSDSLLVGEIGEYLSSFCRGMLGYAGCEPWYSRTCSAATERGKIFADYRLPVGGYYPLNGCWPRGDRNKRRRVPDHMTFVSGRSRVSRIIIWDNVGSLQCVCPQSLFSPAAGGGAREIILGEESEGEEPKGRQPRGALEQPRLFEVPGL